MRPAAGEPRLRGAPKAWGDASPVEPPPFTWVWVKIKPTGNGPQVLVHVSICQGKPFWVPIFDPQPYVTYPGESFSMSLAQHAQRYQETKTPRKRPENESSSCFFLLFVLKQTYHYWQYVIFTCELKQMEVGVWSFWRLSFVAGFKGKSQGRLTKTHYLMPDGSSFSCCSGVTETQSWIGMCNPGFPSICFYHQEMDCRFSSLVPFSRASHFGYLFLTHSHRSGTPNRRGPPSQPAPGCEHWGLQRGHRHPLGGRTGAIGGRPRQRQGTVVEVLDATSEPRTTAFSHVQNSWYCPKSSCWWVRVHGTCLWTRIGRLIVSLLALMIGAFLLKVWKSKVCHSFKRTTLFHDPLRLFGANPYICSTCRSSKSWEGQTDGSRSVTHRQVLRIFIDRLPSLDFLNNRGETPLHYAALGGQTKRKRARRQKGGTCRSAQYITRNKTVGCVFPAFVPFVFLYLCPSPAKKLAFEKSTGQDGPHVQVHDGPHV